MLNSAFSVTMTNNIDRYRPCFYLIGHGGHSGHGVFAHTYARACERTRSKFHFYVLVTLYVYINTMTTMTSMTFIVIARVLAVTVGGHGGWSR